MNVHQVAELAKLRLTDEEAQRMEAELQAVLDFARGMQAVDTQGVEPAAHAGLCNVLREDSAQASLPQETVVRMAASGTEEYISVPKAFD